MNANIGSLLLLMSFVVADAGVKERLLVILLLPTFLPHPALCSRMCVCVCRWGSVLFEPVPCFRGASKGFWRLTRSAPVATVVFLVAM
eukprot:1570775-Pyramimonas_sp.AAC.1